ncbi:helix-turn-helix transcriptional regulator [Luteimonas sp. RD2P54]|uniref:Helix-turn-helix transcriptional regulator n=1 Tax=Luteimonas endophytica TaxID=3042023 RepID=A0ABT6J7A1_9GAMM|nr:helix-turn-helix transcriptional regulator [Luteimonas endophytica]MDH5822704.1 helix-turn-helix transcriptional regulator [Luteimonas endophytica]
MPPKSIHKPEYQTLLEMLVEIRGKAGLKQAELAALLDRSQSYVSDVERGGRRLDLLQLREYCLACNQDLVSFVRRFEKAVGDGSGAKRRASR